MHYARTGHVAHTAGDRGDLGDQGDEHGCGTTQHHCTCCANRAVTPSEGRHGRLGRRARVAPERRARDDRRPARADRALPAEPLRWVDVAAVIERDPRVAASRSRARSAEGGVSAAKTPPNPQVEAGAGRGAAQEGPLAGTSGGLRSRSRSTGSRGGDQRSTPRKGARTRWRPRRKSSGRVSAELWRLFVPGGYAQAQVETLGATE